MSVSSSIVPDNDQDVYLVLDDFGEWGSAWRETDVQDTDFDSVIIDLLEGQYRNPVRVVSFNVSEGWVRDVSGRSPGTSETMRRSAPQASGLLGRVCHPLPLRKT
jgi:hypothetical protein